MSKPSYTVYTKDFANMVCRRLERENKKKDKEIKKLNNIRENAIKYILDHRTKVKIDVPGMPKEYTAYTGNQEEILKILLGE